MRGGMGNMMKQMQKMQKKMLEAQEEVKNSSVEGSAGGGAVKVTMNGVKEIQDLIIDKEVVDPEDVEMLQDLILVAITDASKKADDLNEKIMGPHTQGLNMPGLF
ncbi:MAG: YbaB/EbfC family nucleoid-associated protein [Bacilli bacterium]